MGRFLKTLACHGENLEPPEDYYDDEEERDKCFHLIHPGPCQDDCPCPTSCSSYAECHPEEKQG